MADEVKPASAAGAVAVAEPPTDQTDAQEQISGAGQPTDQNPAETPAQEVEETEVNLEETPASSGDFSKYKPLFKENPELRAILGREKAFSELASSFSELKGIVERVPTLEDAESLATQAEQHRILGETYRTDSAGFISSLRENDANAFNQLARSMPQILAEEAPEAYQEQARFYTSAVMDNLWQLAQQSGDQELQAAIQKVAANGLGYRIGSSVQSTAKPNSEVEKLRRELDELKHGQQSSEVEQFWGELDGAVASFIYTDVEAAIKKAVPQATPAQLTRMVNEAVNLANNTLDSQPQTKAQITQYRKSAEKGRTSVSDFNAALNYVKGRAKLVIPGVTKNVINEWSSSVLKINKETIEKKQDIAARTRDVGTATQARSSAGAPQQKNRPASREDIFRRIEAGMR